MLFLLHWVNYKGDLLSIIEREMKTNGHVPAQERCQKTFKGG